MESRSGVRRRRSHKPKPGKKRQARSDLGQAPPVHRMHPVRQQVGRWQGNVRPVQEVRIWDAKAGLRHVEDQAPINRKIQINRSGRVLVRNAYPPKFGLDGAKELELQAQRRQAGFDQGRGIQEVRAAGAGRRRRLVDRGDRDKPSALGQEPQRRGQVARGLDVGAERDDGGRESDIPLRPVQAARPGVPAQSSASKSARLRSISTPVEAAKRKAPGFSTRTTTRSAP